MFDLRRRNRKTAFSAAFHSGKFHEMKFFFFTPSKAFSGTTKGALWANVIP